MQPVTSTAKETRAVRFIPAVFKSLNSSSCRFSLKSESNSPGLHRVTQAWIHLNPNPVWRLFIRQSYQQIFFVLEIDFSSKDYWLQTSKRAVNIGANPYIKKLRCKQSSTGSFEFVNNYKSLHKPLQLNSMCCRNWIDWNQRGCRIKRNHLPGKTAPALMMWRLMARLGLHR